MDSLKIHLRSNLSTILVKPSSISNKLRRDSLPLPCSPVKFITKKLDGAQIGELPIKYCVKNILANEFPVVGVYVDPSIISGFKYKVRCLSDDPSVYETSFLFNGSARCLLNIGAGYAKRFTFQGATLNNNKNYFWSDNIVEGYAFSLESIEVGQQFTIYMVDFNLQKCLDGHMNCFLTNSNMMDPIESENTDSPENYSLNLNGSKSRQPIGDATITSVYGSECNELKTVFVKGNGKQPVKIEKHVEVKFKCNIKFNVPVIGFPIKDSEYTLKGVAIVVKENTKGSLAQTLEINNIVVPQMGKCIFNRA